MREEMRSDERVSSRSGDRAGVASVDQASVGDLVAQVDGLLKSSGIPDSRREARDLVAAVFDAPRFWPLLEPRTPVTTERAAEVLGAAARRASGAPFAYAVGRASFRYLTLAVDRHVLIPRQETESLVELVLAHTRRARPSVALDIGTGSGAIALSLASEGTFERVVATDISLDALRVAEANATASGIDTPVAFLHGDGFAPVAAERFDVIVSNPPYIAFDELPMLPPSVRDWEPLTALACADEGLALTTRLVSEAPLHLTPGGLLALEVDERRGRRVLALVEATPHLVAARLHQDLAGRDRFVTALMDTTSTSGDDR